jgi:hypothetical protein
MAERTDGVAARLRNSGKDFRLLRCTSLTTSDAGEFLTSRHNSWIASRRRDSGDGGKSTAAAGSLG